MVVLVNVAVPLASAALPKVVLVVASVKVTVSPLAGVPAVELTVAVRVTLAPNVIVLGATVRLVVETP
jgi:hypothetical protein